MFKLIDRKCNGEGLPIGPQPLQLTLLADDFCAPGAGESGEVAVVVAGE